MRIVNLSYSIPQPRHSNPEAWLKKILFSIGILECMAVTDEVIGIYHIRHSGVLNRKNVTYYFTNYNRFQLLVPFQFHRLVTKLSPEVIIVHGLISPWQVILLRWSVGSYVRIFAQHHAERPLRFPKSLLQKWVDRGIEGYFFASKDLAIPWLKKKQIGSESRIHEVMEASSEFSPSPIQSARLKTGIIGERVYLWVGRLDENKDPITMGRAFFRFAEKYPEHSFYMIYQSVELERELIKIVGGHKNIHLVGKIQHDELQDWYNASDFIVSSSHYEGSGIAVCEAMSCGCIPILTNIPSFRMMTDNGRIGLLFEAGNEELLLNALEQSLKLDQPEVRKKVLEHFSNVLSFEAIAKKILEVIRPIQ